METADYRNCVQQLEMACKWETKRDTVTQWLALLPHNKKFLCLNQLPAEAFLCWVCMFNLCVQGFVGKGQGMLERTSLRNVLSEHV